METFLHGSCICNPNQEYLGLLLSCGGTACLTKCCNRWIQALQERQAEKARTGPVLHLKERLSCMRLLYGTGENLQMRVRGETTNCDTVVGMC